MRNHYHINPINLFLIFITITIFFSLNFISCSSSQDFTEKPVGNNIDVIMEGNSLYTDLELLFIYEDTLYTLYSESKVFPIPIKQIEKISVNGYSDRSWIFAVIGLQVIPSILMGVAASSENVDGAWALTGVMLIPAVIEAILFEASTPVEPLFESPLDEKTLILKKYARYPIKLSRENINTIEKFYGITKVKNTTKQE
jgi:hypothetical protein